MKKLCLIACVLFTPACLNAGMITNGDFEGQIRFRSDVGSRTDWVGEPVGWYSSLYHNGQINGNYGEPISGYGDGICAALKAEGGNYYQQTLSGVDAGTVGTYTVSYDGGIRYHSSYLSDARDITLRVSLWDATADVELVGVDVVTAYDSSATSLEARSHLLSYDPTGLAGHEIALRFANTTVNPANGANENQALIDNVSIVPEPGTISLLAFGGLAAFRYKR